MLIELNIDALVGPTLHFGGLGVGNVASQQHQFQPSSPRRGALEGLEKAWRVAQLGVPQFIWLPPSRPRFRLLDDLGFSGPPADKLKQALETAPRVLSAAYSSAFMWAANSATYTPANDSVDDRNHFTPANLISSWHRGSEATERTRDLRALFGPFYKSFLHRPLPAILPLRDEGAANHMRLSSDDGRVGFHIFVYGEREDSPAHEGTLPEFAANFYPRNALAASQAISRHHRLFPARVSFFQQHPDAIRAGVFHNDVIATSHQRLLLYHQRAFLDAEGELDRFESRFLEATGQPLIRRQITESELPLEDAVRSYFFNSQIVSPEQNGRDRPRMVLICPEQCRRIDSAHRLIDRLVADTDIPIEDVQYCSLGESMAGGGGPACLRLRVQLPEDQLAQLPRSWQLDSRLYERLHEAIERTYPERLDLERLADRELPKLAQAATRAVRAATEESN